MTHALTPQAATRTTIFSFTSAALISATGACVCNIMWSLMPMERKEKMRANG